MTMFLVQLIAAWLILLFLYISALAIGARAFGVEVLEVSFGSGKVLWSRGYVKLRAILLTGYVKLKDTREFPDDEPVDLSTTYNHKPACARVLVLLTGCAVMVLVATLLLAGAGISEVIAGFRQLILGAFAPTSTAQHYIQATQALWINDGFLALLGVLAAKNAAVNLFPLPFTCGGQMILTLIPSSQRGFPAWHTTLMNITIFPWIAVFCSWAFAIIYFAIGAGSR